VVLVDALRRSGSIWTFGGVYFGPLTGQIRVAINKSLWGNQRMLIVAKYNHRCGAIILQSQKTSKTTVLNASVPRLQNVTGCSALGHEHVSTEQVHKEKLIDGRASAAEDHP